MHDRIKAATVLVIVSSLLCSPVRAGEPAGYENRWLAIAGGAPTPEGAWRILLQNELEASILLSTRFAGLEPGWFIVVAGAYPGKKSALQEVRKLKRRGLEAYTKNAGAVHDFATEKVRVTSLPTVVERCARHEGKTSPDGKIELDTRPEDPTSDKLVVRRGGGEQAVEGLFFQTERFVWSPDGSRVAFGDEDLYAGSGTRGLVVVDTLGLTAIKIPTDTLGERKRRGKRNMLRLTDLCWKLSSDGLTFRLAANFEGSSGHPGIDLEIKERLGENFGRDDPVDLGHFGVYLEPRPVDLESPPPGLRIHDPEAYGYIDKTGAWVIKPRFEMAWPFAGKVAKVRIDGKESYIDTSGRPAKRPVSAAKPAAVSPGTPVPTRLGERWGYMEAAGMIVIDPLFDEAHPFREGLARVRVGGKFGFIDPAGKQAIEPRFDAAGDFSAGLAPARLGAP